MAVYVRKITAFAQKKVGSITVEDARQFYSEIAVRASTRPRIAT